MAFAVNLEDTVQSASCRRPSDCWTYRPVKSVRGERSQFVSGPATLSIKNIRKKRKERCS